MTRFRERVVIVTAAGGSGTGGVTARRFACEGAVVVACDVNGDGLDALAKSAEGIAGQLVTYTADVSIDEQVRAVVGDATARFGRVDVLVNHAGSSTRGQLHETSDAEWSRVIANTLDSVFYCSRAALPYLRESRGCIVNTASVSGMGGDHSLAAYNAAKGAVINLTRAMAVDYGREGVRVNSVSPAGVYFPGTQQLWDPIVDEYLDRIPLGRFAFPADVAAAIAFLASDDAAYITGHNLPVDGGLTAASGQYHFADPRRARA